MTIEGYEPEFIYSVRSRGGMGRGAVWQWEIYGPDRGMAIEKGQVTGAQSKADEAGRDAVGRWETKAEKARDSKRD